MNTLVPELGVSDLTTSLAFYRELLGFNVKFERPENKFVYLSFFGSELMLEEDRERNEKDSAWIVEPLDYPRGRGLNISIECPDAKALASQIESAGIELRKEVEEYWYRDNSIEHGELNFLVQDPDGYLLRFAQSLGTRALRS
ncbi:VOC family protein [bacterium]|nr:VOC family protein [bacterium]